MTNTSMAFEAINKAYLTFYKSRKSRIRRGLLLRKLERLTKQISDDPKVLPRIKENAKEALIRAQAWHELRCENLVKKSS